MQVQVTKAEIIRALQIPSTATLIVDGADFSVCDQVQEIKDSIPDAKLNAIKCFRELFGVGLKEAKDIIEIMTEYKRSNFGRWN